MAQFKMELPKSLIDEIQTLDKESEEMFGEMTRAGADVVATRMRENAPSNLKSYVKTSRTYKTPSDGGINTKVYVSGYIPFSNPNREYFARRGGNGKMYYETRGVPAEFLANLYEYGRSTAPFPKHPFVRKSFKDDGAIEEAMNNVQTTYIKDIFGADAFVTDWINNGYGGGY